MKHKLILFYSFFSLMLAGQTIAEGEAFFNEGKYGNAREVYKALLIKNPSNLLNNYKYARCCYELNLQEEAIRHFEASNKELPLRNYFLGNLYFDSYRFEASIEAYNTYLKLQKADTERVKIEEIKKKIQQARTAAELLKRVEDIAIIDSMVVDKKDFLNFYELSSELGTIKQDHIFMKDKWVDKVRYTTQRQNMIYFSEYNDNQMDIYSSHKLLNDWSKPTSISKEINTQANENYPFLMPDGITILFASDGNNSIGGYDIFVSQYTLTTNSYFPPENIGMPFNSPYNDYMLVIDELNGIGWFATDRYQPENKVVIYKFAPNEQKIIIRSSDESYIREVAQLKKYRRFEDSPKSPKQQQISSNNDNTEQNVIIKPNERQIEFVVNDTIVYHYVSQFKGKKSLQLYMELRALTNGVDIMTSELDAYRNQYIVSQTNKERGQLAPEILRLEKSIKEQIGYIAEKTSQIREEELKMIRK